MELLLVLIAEFLALPALAVAALAVFLLLFAAEAALYAVPFLVAAAGAAFKARAWLRRLRWALLAVTIALAVGVVLLNTVLFEPGVRWVFSRARARSGIDVTFASARGNFVTGRVTLKDVAVRRQGHPRSNFDLKAGEVRLDVRLWSALRKEVAFESLSISGLEGTFDRVAPHGDRSRGRDFVVGRLALENASIRFRDRPLDEKPAEMALALERLECAPFRRRHAVFDALFRSNAKGAIDGAPFAIRAEEVAGGRKTLWKGEGIPLRFLADYAGGGFAWFRSGRADLEVVDSWSDGEVKEIDMHWKVRLKAFTAEVPAGLKGWMRPVAEAAVAFLNRHALELPLEFDLMVNKDEFDGAISVEATGLLVAVGDAVAKSLAELAEVQAETLKDWGRKSLERFKEFLDRWRRK